MKNDKFSPEELRGWLREFQDRLKTDAGYTQENARRHAIGADLFVDFLSGILLEKKRGGVHES